MFCGQAGAAGAIAAGHDCWGSMLFCLSLNHKQMSMYYAPAFFAHLLGKCLQKPFMTQQVHADSSQIQPQSLTLHAAPKHALHVLSHGCTIVSAEAYCRLLSSLPHCACQLLICSVQHATATSLSNKQPSHGLVCCKSYGAGLWQYTTCLSRRHQQCYK
jgi:hypothetical protein